jgi:uncharacterized RDD family membrane protein YckC
MSLKEYAYAGFWIRFGAACIDLIVLLIVTGIPLSLIYGPAYWSSDAMFKGFWDVAISLVLPMVATIWLWSQFGATPGKMALKLKVLDARTGSNPSIGRSVNRYLAYLASTLPFALGYIWIGVDKKKRGFHDMLAGTVVVRDTAAVAVDFDAPA